MNINVKTVLRPVMLSLLPALLFSSNATAFEAGDIIVRAGVANVSPSVSSSNISVDDTEQTGTGVDVNDNTQLGILGTYMLTNQWGVSVLASSPFKHDISGENIGIDDIGSTKQLPPTLTLDYFPLKHTNPWQPHIGLGLNYTIFYSEDSSSELDSGLGGGTRLDLTNSLGLAVKAGLDYRINDRFGLNATVFWIDIDTEATITSNTSRVTVDVDVDPFVYMFTASYKF